MMKSERVWAVVRNDIFPAQVKAVFWTSKEAENEVNRLNSLGSQSHYFHETKLFQKPSLAANLEEISARVRNSTPEQFLESLQRAGILDENKQITDHYK